MTTEANGGAGAAAAADQATAASAAAAAPAAGEGAGAGAGAAAAAPWYADDKLGFDQETQDYIGTKGWKTPVEFAKSARQFDTLARDRNAIAAPVPGKEGEWEHHDKLGWVKDPAKYVAEPPQMPAGVEWDQAMHSSVLEVMHQHRVPLPAAQAVIAALGKAAAAGVERELAADTQSVDQSMAKLRTKWGSEYDAKMDLAQRVVRTFGAQPGMIDNAADILGFAPLTEFLVNIGSRMSEDVFVSGAGAGGVASHPASARAQRLQLEADPQFTASLRDPRHPQHATNRARRDQLLAAESVR